MKSDATQQRALLRRRVQSLRDTEQLAVCRLCQVCAP
eukprot:COSAG06_NODE_38254_length_425_cov_1.420245_2_plen_36_part_01